MSSEAEKQTAETNYRATQKKSPWYLPAKAIFEDVMEKSSSSWIFNCEEKTWEELDIAEVDAFLYIAKVSFLHWRKSEHPTCEICDLEYNRCMCMGNP